MVAASVAGVGSALAADLAPVEPEKDVFFSVQVGALEGEAAADKLGLTPDDEFAITGAVAFGRDIDEDWDWRLRIFGTGFNEAPRGRFRLVSSDLDYVGGDVEFGRSGVHRKRQVVRAFAGLGVLVRKTSLTAIGDVFECADSDFPAPARARARNSHRHSVPVRSVSRARFRLVAVRSA